MLARCCTKCLKTKDMSEFYRKGDDWHEQCKSCHRARTRQYAKDNPDKVRENKKKQAKRRAEKYPEKVSMERKAQKRKQKLKQWGITLEDLQKVFDRQRGLCAI